MIRNNSSPLGRHLALALWLCLAVLAAGCGQRGPLYLPDEEQAGQQQTEQQQTGQEAQTQSSPEEQLEEKDEENS